MQQFWASIKPDLIKLENPAFWIVIVTIIVAAVLYAVRCNSVGME